MSEIEKTLIEEIKQIINITSRVDERVKMIADSQNQIGQRLEHFIDEHNELASKVYVIEAKNGSKAYELISKLDDRLDILASKLEIIELIGSKKHTEEIADHEDTIIDILHRTKNLEEHKSNISDKIKTVFNHVVQGVFFIAIAYILYKLGINPPPGQ
jgi:hypothetical protein